MNGDISTSLESTHLLSTNSGEHSSAEAPSYGAGVDHLARIDNSASGSSASGTGRESFGTSTQSFDSTAEALKRSVTFLRPYRIVFAILGWTSYVYANCESRSRRFMLRSLRVGVWALWLLGLIVGVLAQTFTCFRIDLGVPDEMWKNPDNQMIISCQRHVVTLHLVDDLLTTGAYLFGIYLFSSKKTEYLSNLANRTFIKCSRARMGKQSKQLACILIIFLFGGAAFIVISLLTRILSTYELGLFNEEIKIVWTNYSTTNITNFRDLNSSNMWMIKDGAKLTLVILSVLGFVVYNIVYVVVVLNYAAQSEMNIKLLHAVQDMAEQRLYPNLEDAMKDIFECQRYLKVLNGKTAAATALILFILAAATVTSLTNMEQASAYMDAIKAFGENGKMLRDFLGALAWGMNFVLCLLLASLPFIQAARVTAACESLRNTGPIIRSRPLQYIRTPQIELDSYVTFTSAITLRAEMFGIPIYPWMVYFATVAFLLTMLLLFQTKNFNFFIDYI